MDEPRIYRASSLGYSLEQLVCPHLGYDAIPPPDWLQEKYDEGSALEEPILALMRRDDGWGLDSEQLEVNIDVIPGVATVQGHLDGIGELNGQRYIVEVKTMNPKMWANVLNHGWDAGGIMEKYKWQASAYMLGAGLPLVMVCYNKETGTLLYQYADAPFYTIADIANKLQVAEDHIRDGVIPEGCADYPCPYFYLHEAKVEAEEADKQLDELLSAWLKADHAEKACKRDKDELRAAIVEYVGSEGKAKVKGSNGVTVSVNWQEGGEVVQNRQAKWVTSVSAPRIRKVGNVTE